MPPTVSIAVNQQLLPLSPPSKEEGRVEKWQERLKRGPPLWISLWFALSSLLVIWDFGYCFLRPRSMAGGDLVFLWKPYLLYEKIDKVYSREWFDAGNGFTNAQALMNVFETILNFEYLYLTHSSPTPHPVAPLVGFSGALMTLSKTMLYYLQEYFCGYCGIGHNSRNTLIFLWILPNTPWIIFPLIITNTLGSHIASCLRYHARDVALDRERLDALAAGEARAGSGGEGGGMGLETIEEKEEEDADPEDEDEDEKEDGKESLRSPTRSTRSQATATPVKKAGIIRGGSVLSVGSSAAAEGEGGRRTRSMSKQ